MLANINNLIDSSKCMFTRFITLGIPPNPRSTLYLQATLAKILQYSQPNPDYWRSSQNDCSQNITQACFCAYIVQEVETEDQQLPWMHFRSWMELALPREGSKAPNKDWCWLQSAKCWIARLSWNLVRILKKWTTYVADRSLCRRPWSNLESIAV